MPNCVVCAVRTGNSYRTSDPSKSRGPGSPWRPRRCLSLLVLKSKLIILFTECVVCWKSFQAVTTTGVCGPFRKGPEKRTPYHCDTLAFTRYLRRTTHLCRTLRCRRPRGSQTCIPPDGLSLYLRRVPPKVRVRITMRSVKAENPPDLVKKDSTVLARDWLWVVDITYIPDTCGIPLPLRSD